MEVEEASAHTYDNLGMEVEETSRPTYDDQLNKLFNYYEEAIQRETFLLCNVKIENLLVNFTINCGLSPAMNFEPAVQITNQHGIISFCISEWVEFVRILKQLNDVYFDEKTVASAPHLYAFWLDKTLTLNDDCVVFKSIVLSKNNVNFNFVKFDVIEIISMHLHVLKEIERLLELCFYSYYSKLLASVDGLIKINNSNDDGVLDIMKSLCKISNNENDVQNRIINEMLLYYSSKIMLDFNCNYKTL